MKTRIYNLVVKVLAALSRRPSAAMTLASVLAVVAGVGIWAYTVHAAQVRTEKIVRTEANTLNRVVAKLNAMNKTLHKQSDTLVAKLNALRSANAQLAAYAIETSQRGTGAEPVLTPVARQRFLTTTTWSAHLCADGHVDLGQEVTTRLEGMEGLLGGLGFDWSKNGAAAKLRGMIKEWGEVKGAGGLTISMEFCAPEIDYKPLTAYSDLSSYLDQTIPPVGQAVATQVASFVQNHPNVVSFVPNEIQAFNNFHSTLSKGALLKMFTHPKQAFSSVQQVLTSMPLSGNLATVMSDPTSFLPKLSDLRPKNLCSGVGNGAPQFMETLCTEVKSINLGDSNNLSKFITNVTKVPSYVSATKNGLYHVNQGLQDYCNSLVKTIGGIVGFVNKLDCTHF